MVWRHLSSTWCSLIFHNCLDTCGTNLFPYDLNINKALLSNWRHIKPLSIRFRICWLLRRAEWGMKLQSKDSDSEVIDSVHCGSTLELAGTTKVGHGTRRYKAPSDYLNLKNFINYWLQRINNRKIHKGRVETAISWIEPWGDHEFGLWDLHSTVMLSYRDDLDRQFGTQSWT